MIGTFISFDDNQIIAVDEIAYISKEITYNNKRKKDNYGVDLPKTLYSIVIYMKHSPDIVKWYRTEEQRDNVFHTLKNLRNNL